MLVKKRSKSLQQNSNSSIFLARFLNLIFRNYPSYALSA